MTLPENNGPDDEAGHNNSAPENSSPPQRYLHPSLACFVLLAKFLGVPADPEQIAHDRGKGDDHYSLEDLSRIAKKLGLIARLRPTKTEELRKLPLPHCSTAQMAMPSSC